MRIAREGYPVIAVPALATAAAAVLGWVWPAIVAGAATLAVSAFFRDPDRTPPAGEDLILAPADGRVVEIRELDTAPGAQGTRVSIFMSPLDVHVNRAPVAGTVAAVEYQKGCFLPAYKED